MIRSVSSVSFPPVQGSLYTPCCVAFKSRRVCSEIMQLLAAVKQSLWILKCPTHRLLLLIHRLVSGEPFKSGTVAGYNVRSEIIVR